MRATPGPRDPAPLWLIDAEDRLLEERREEDANGNPLPDHQVIPGGLLNMVVDAAECVGDTIEKLDTPGQSEETRKARKYTGRDLCNFVAWNAHLITLDYPAAEDLLALMKDQAHWISARLMPRGADEVANRPEPYQLAEVVIQRMASRGVTVTNVQLRNLASRGQISQGGRDGRRVGYRMSEVIKWCEEHHTTL